MAAARDIAALDMAALQIAALNIAALGTADLDPIIALAITLTSAPLNRTIARTESLLILSCVRRMVWWMAE
jgi:hypothetical protein